MKTLPNFMRLYIGKKGHRGIRLTFPLVLLYLLLLLLAIILLPLLLIATIVLLPWGWGWSLLLIYPRFYALLCALKELEVDIEDKKQNFYVSFK